MNALEQSTANTTLDDLTREILDCANRNDIGNLPELVARVKALGPRNVYLIAVEKQVAKLTAPDATPEQRTEVLKAFPVLMERAGAEARRIAAAPARPDPNEERREAMDKMKRQYFERADSYVDRGEFQRALEEVRRVLILDATNVLALEYEQKIERLTDGGKGAAASANEPPAGAGAPAVVAIGPARKLHLVVTLALFVVVAGLSAAYLLLRNHDGKATDALAAPAQVAGTIGAVPPASPASGTGTGSASLPAAAGTSADQPSSPSPVTRTSASEDPSALNASAPPAPATNPPTTTQPGAGAIPSVNGTASPSAVPQTAPATAPAQELPPPPQPFVPLESAVEIVRIPAAKYPETAMKNRIEGRVVVEVAVSPEGKPVGSKILNSDNEMFDDAATEAAMNGTYKPATMNDAPVASKVSIPFNFRLKH